MKLLREDLLNIVLAIILLGFIMLLLGFGQTIGAHKDTNEAFALGGKLTMAQELVRGSRADQLWDGQLKMFGPSDKVYKIVIEKEAAKYDFLAALPESPEPFVGQQVILEYSFIRNIFGGVIGAGCSCAVTPIYGKIHINTCADE